MKCDSFFPTGVYMVTVQRMKDLSSSFKIGFGTFIDKPIFPFADKFV